MYQISRNALEDGTFPDAMTVDVAIDQIYAEPSSPGMIPDTINGNWKLQVIYILHCRFLRNGRIKILLPLVTNSNGEEISILSGYCTSLEDGSQRFHYTLEYNDDTEFTVQILDKNNAPSDSTIPVVAEIPVSMQ